MNNDMIDISVEVQALNLEGIKKNLLEYVQKQAQIDIDGSVNNAAQSAESAETSAGNAAQSALQASDCAEQASESLGNYYTKGQVDDLLGAKQDTLVSGTNIKTINSTSVLGSGNLALADQSLSNLDSTGRMVIDSQNGTISNCILEIPQNIKLTLENNVLTLKAGSIITLPGNTYTTVTTTQDNTVTISTNDTFVVFSRNNGLSIGNYVRLNKIGSGSSLPADDTTYQCFYNSTDKLIYLWNNNQWTEWNVGYPLCVVKVENGNMSFVKDSNGNDMIFNGAGFIGHHAFVYPNVKALIPNGFNEDGSLKSINTTRTNLSIVEFLNTTSSANKGCIGIGDQGSIGGRLSYFEVDNIEDMDSLNVQGIYYIKNENEGYSWSGGAGIKYPNYTKFIGYLYDGTIVTDFTIRQSVRTATVEMLQKSLGDVETLLAAI